MQQFLNHNAAIFSALAKSGQRVDSALDGDILKQPVTDAHMLAREVAALVLSKDLNQVTAADAKPFRATAAEIVSDAYYRGNRIDIKAAAANIATVCEMADFTWDHDLYKDDGVRHATSVKMSAASIAASLIEVVSVYDFRLGREEVLGHLMKAVVDASANAADAMLSSDATAGEVSNLTQTLSRTMTGIMSSCYERKARAVVSLLEKAPEQAKRRWLEDNNPLGEVLAEFSSWSKCMCGFAIASASEISKPQKESSRGNNFSSQN